MSVQTLSDWISCLNKDESVESIFKRLIAVSSSGTLYLRTDASIYLALSKITATFTDADLITVTIGSTDHECYLLTHNFGSQSFDYIVKDSNGNIVIVSNTVIDNNSCYIQIDDTITGTWTIYAYTI